MKASGFTRFLVIAAAGIALVSALHVLDAQEASSPPAAPTFQNLQVLPKDITAERLVNEMQMFEYGLGVDCDYCHATNGQPVTMGQGGALPGGFDFASDDRPAKQTARRMLAMLRAINAMTPAAVGKPPENTERIECFSCHRGMTTPPLPLRNVLERTTAEKGLSEAIAQYRELRGKYHGTAAYDFGDPAGGVGGSGGTGLPGYASQLFFDGKLDEAQAWLNVNLEYYPRSADSWSFIAFLKLGKNDLAGAIESLDQAIALDPQNLQLKQLKEEWLKAVKDPAP